MEYKISYGGKTFKGKIFAGVFTVDADSLETAQEGAFGIISGIRKDNEEDGIDWHTWLQNIKIDVSENIQG